MSIVYAVRIQFGLPKKRLSQKSKFFTTKVQKGFSQRAQNIAKQVVVSVSLCVYFVFFVVKKTFKTALM